MRLGMIGFVATIMLVGPTSASGQSWQFTKSSPLPSEASAFAGADAGSKSDRDGGTHQGELLADAGATATAERIRRLRETLSRRASVRQQRCA
jgi:hypothetical protein